MTCAYLFPPPSTPSSSCLAICTALTPVLKQGTARGGRLSYATQEKQASRASGQPLTREAPLALALLPPLELLLR